jgi:hypothetical protein
MPKESSKSSIYGTWPIDRNYSSISYRLLLLIARELKDQKNKFSELEKRTKVERNSWIQWHRRAHQAEPAARLIQAAALEWPQYAFWLVTGYTDPASGHVSPIGSKSGRHGAVLGIQNSRKDQHLEIGKVTQDYFKISIDLIRKMYGEESDVELINSRTDTQAFESIRDDSIQKMLDFLLLERCKLALEEINELMKEIKKK